MHDSNDRPLISTRGAELLVAIFFIVICGISAWDSWKLGAGWGDNGPQSGYFPFYTSIFVVIAGAIIALLALRDKEAAAETFVTVPQSKLVLKVLIPTIIYVIAISFLGIYVSSIIFIAFFMMWLGKYHFLKAGAVGLGVNVVFFLLFERWFHVPLPKGPLETMLGLY